MNNYRKNFQTFLISFFSTVLLIFIVLLSNGGSLWSPKYYVSFQEAKVKVDDYTSNQTFYDLNEYQKGLDYLELKGINLEAKEINFLNTEKMGAKSEIKIEVTFSLQKNYNWQDLLVGDQKVEYNLVIDTREIINRQELFNYVQKGLNTKEYNSQIELDKELEKITAEFSNMYPSVNLVLIPMSNIDSEAKTKWLIDIEASINFDRYKWDNNAEGKYSMKNIEVTKDISILVYQEDINEEIDLIFSKINSTKDSNYSINEVIQTFNMNYSTSPNNKLNGTFILNQTVKKELSSENGFDNYSITVQIGLDNEYKWAHDRTKEVKEFSFDNLMINTKVIELNDVLEQLKELQLVEFYSTDHLNEELQKKVKDGYSLELMNKNEIIHKDFIAEIKISLSQEYVWNNKERTNQDIFLKLIINESKNK